MATREHNPTDRGDEERHVDEIARAHEALAAAQDRTYWLDRWGLDLDTLMAKPGAGQVHRFLRAAVNVWRRRVSARRKAAELRGKLRGSAPATVERAPRLSVFERSISPNPLNSSIATDLLFDRLEPDAVAAVEATLDADQQNLLDTVDPVERRRRIVNIGVYNEIAAVLEPTGLTPAMPPDHVHAMARGVAATGGSLYYADLVADGFAAAGFEPAAGTSVLDFGSSSGRAVRVLRAAFPQAEWKGCDPVAAAVAWAQENLEGIEFLVSPERPPLPYAAESIDAAYAISIWSHFNAPAARVWFDEMRRILKPGGLLLATTHGPQTVRHHRATRQRHGPQLDEISSALDRDGFWFRNEFGPGGDHGLADPDWGTAFMTAEWLLDTVTPEWKVVATAPGRVEDNQDLYVLEKR